jgi:hypothetical protein
MRCALRVLVVLLVTASSVIASAVDASARSLTPTAHELLAAALQASQAAGSLNFVAKTTSGKTTEVVQGAVSAPTASETVTGLGTPFEVELIGHEVYVRGDQAVLEHSLQLTATEAAGLVGKWVSVQSTDSAFTSLVSSLTITSVLNSFIASHNLRKEKKTKVGGRSVIPLVGQATTGASHGAKGSAALLISAKKPHLPVGGSVVVAKGRHETREIAVFKDWGVTVKLMPPTDATTVVSVLKT